MVAISELLGHALTGEAASLERLLDEVNQMKHELIAMKPGPMKKKLEQLATGTSVSGGSAAWIIEKLCQFLGS
jgi:hypothetical protein